MKIKLNDKFYRYIDAKGVFEYVVVGIRQYESDEMYELECQTCTHGWKCLLLCSLNDHRMLQYVKMINDDEYSSQKHWHQYGGEFYKTKKEALISKGKKMIKYWDDEIIKTKQRLESCEKRKEQDSKAIQDLIDELEKKNEENN